MKKIFILSFLTHSFIFGMNHGEISKINFKQNMNKFSSEILAEEEIIFELKKKYDLWEKSSFYTLLNEPENTFHIFSSETSILNYSQESIILEKNIFNESEKLLIENNNKDEIFLDSLENNYSLPRFDKEADLFKCMRHSIMKHAYFYKEKKYSEEIDVHYSNHIKNFIDQTKPLLKKQHININSFKKLNSYLVSFFNTTLPLNNDILENLFNALSIALKTNIEFSFKGKNYFSIYPFEDNLKLNIRDSHWDVTEGHQVMIKSMEGQ